IVRTLLLDALEQRDHATHMPGLGSADPVIVAALEPAPVVGEDRSHPVDPLPRRHAAALGRLNHRLAVLVHPHQKAHLVAAQAPIARDRVGPDFFQGVPQVGIAVGVIDGGREIELGWAHYTRNCSSVTTRVVPSSDRRVTRSRKISTETTRSLPSAVFTVLPSF